MLIEVDPRSSAVRLDDEGLEAVLHIAASEGAAGHPTATALMESGLLRHELLALRDPVVSIDLVVASATTRLRHRAFLVDDAGVALLRVSPGLHQLMRLPPAYVASALVRLSRLRPRQIEDRVDVPFPTLRLGDLVSTDRPTRAAALHDASADLAWRLTMRGAREPIEVTATDGPGGVRLADPGADVLRAVTNTAVYRIFTTAVPAAAPA